MRVFLLAVAALAATPPASAHTISVGDTQARSCYEAARSQSRDDEAVRTCTAALGMSLNAPFDRVATLINRGIVRMYRGEYQQALADYDAALAERPDQAEAMLNKGVVLLRFEGREPEAKTLFDRAIAAGTQKPELAYLGRGVAHELAGDVRAAYADYRQAAVIQPGWVPAERELRRFQVRRVGGGSGQGLP